MGYLKYVREAWKKPRESSLWKERLISWRTESATTRIDHPTRPDRARSLGYVAKQGFIVVRQRVLRGGHRRPGPPGGRRPRHARRRMVLDKSYQRIAEERAAKKFPNCEALNSYWVGDDGKHYWYEVILIDKAHPVILADPRISWIAETQHTHRVLRGLTRSGRKSRGLLHKGTGSEHARPSKAAYYGRKVRRQKKISRFIKTS
ncbi:50S ribosomal protein L15e [Candidatus Woesearchaeota archaeon CG10_big_fil_rev_8_21_14_0_10_44_13]|nr:MAG: 50S ribosomal protein L15e [Candidatus Woesearchaeota archaeon CG10_big_fil_rev_8_21_14_0_10_44_13]